MDNNPPGPDEAALPQAPSIGKAARILVVDDDTEVSSAVADMVSRLGHVPSICHRADEVLSYLASHPVDLLLIDYRMPEMTGLDLVRLLREENRSIPIVMMTGYAQTESRLSAGPREEFIILKKPIAMAQLAKAIEESLKEIGPVPQTQPV